MRHLGMVSLMIVPTSCNLETLASLHATQAMDGEAAASLQATQAMD